MYISERPIDKVHDTQQVIQSFKEEFPQGQIRESGQSEHHKLFLTEVPLSEQARLAEWIKRHNP